MNKPPMRIKLRLSPSDRELLEQARKVFQTLYLPNIPDPIPLDVFASQLVVSAAEGILDGKVRDFDV